MSDDRTTPSTPPIPGLINDYWRAANYLAAGQIYLRSNPLLKRPLEPSDVKPRPVGRWGTAPALSLIYAHANRLIIEYDLNAIFVAGPGHGAPAIVANCYLEGTYTERYPHITKDEEGLTRLFQQFSFPGGISSHVAADIPGSINEGGELGYSLMHAYGAVFDNPDLLAFAWLEMARRRQPRWQRAGTRTSLSIPFGMALSCQFST